MHKSLPFFLAAGILAFGWAAQQKKPTRQIPPEQQEALSRYLHSHWQTPEEYVVSKFRDHDIVLVGEHHHIRHDVELIQNLIPHLYKNGVYDLGIEFGCREYQAKVDSLLAADTYDEDLARWLLFKWGSYWPYKEYEDIYRKTWEFNRTLPPGTPRFRVVHLDYRPVWPLVEENMPREVWARVFFRGDRDEFMFKVVRDEFIKKKRRSLIYAGQFHTFTRFHAPDYNIDTQKRPVAKKGTVLFSQFPGIVRPENRTVPLFFLALNKV